MLVGMVMVKRVDMQTLAAVVVVRILPEEKRISMINKW